MDSIKRTELNILKRLMALLLILAGVSFFVFKDPFPIIYGLFFGATISYLNFRLLRLSITKAVKMGQGKIMPYMVSSYMLRYLITGIVLAIAIVAPYLDFLATALGFFLIKLIIHSTNLLSFVKKDIKL